MKLDDFALQVAPCPYCGAYGWCRTVTGNRASWLHVARLHPVMEAWSSGYLDGIRDERAYPGELHL